MELFVTTDMRTLMPVWTRDLPLRRMIDEGRIEPHGPTALARAFPGCLLLGLFAALSAAAAGAPRAAPPDLRRSGPRPVAFSQASVMMAATNQTRPRPCA